MDQEKLQVLWVTKNGVESDWEVDYIRELLDLSGIPYEMKTVSRMEQVIANALIVINHSVQYIPYLRQYEQRCVPFGVIHLSDEWFDDDISFYNFEMCKFVFRNYYHEQFETCPGGHKVRFLPLSYKNEFWGKNCDKVSCGNITFRDRNYVWSFAGAKRSERTDREKTLALFEQVTPHKTHYESGNSFSNPIDGLSTEDYRALLLNTQFGLCPRGISNTLSGDTCQVTESLEAGCIPIVLRGRNSKGDSYWKSLYGKDAPFVMGDTWEECLDQMQALIASGADLCEARRLECYAFWSEVKKEIGAKLAGVLKESGLYPPPNPAAGLDWSRFKAVFVSRHSMHDDKIHELYRMNLRILNYIPWPKVAVQNPPALEYMIHCVESYKNEFDWVINLDDDAFLCDFKALYDLMVHMEENEYDICGMPDGLTYTPRDVFNPVSMNPFFNVIQLKTMKHKVKSPQEMLAPYNPSLLKYVDVAKYHPEMWGKKPEELDGSEFPIGYEPYYPFFYAIAPKVKILWLYGRSYTFDPNAPRESVIIPDEPRRAQTWPFGKKGVTFDDDPWTTILYDHTGAKEICLHTWYARSYGHGQDPTMPVIQNVPRIDRIFKLACQKLALL